MYFVLQSAGKRVGVQDILLYGYPLFITVDCLFVDDCAVICHDGHCQDPHGSALLHGTVHVWKPARSDVRNPCCEVASFSDVIGMERVD